jgi:hypothetical protein
VQYNINEENNELKSGYHSPSTTYILIENTTSHLSALFHRKSTTTASDEVSHAFRREMRVERRDSLLDGIISKSSNVNTS